MIVEYKGDKTDWAFFRKSYRKARWRRLCTRALRVRMGVYPSGFLLVNYPPCNKATYRKLCKRRHF